MSSISIVLVFLNFVYNTIGSIPITLYILMHNLGIDFKTLPPIENEDALDLPGQTEMDLHLNGLRVKFIGLVMLWISFIIFWWWRLSDVIRQKSSANGRVI